MPHKTQRIEPSFHKCLEELNFLKKKHDSQNWTIFPCDSRNWTLLSNMSHRKLNLSFTWLKELNPSFLNMTQRIELFFEYWLKELNFFLNIDSKNWTFCFCLKFDTNQKIESKKTQRIKLSVRIVSQRVKFFFFWKKMTRRNDFSNDSKIELFRMTQIFQYYSKVWTFFKYDSKIELFVWFKELNFFFFDCDSNFNFKMTRSIETTYCNLTQRIEPSFWIWLKELNFLFLEYDAKNWTFFLGYDAKIDPALLNFDTKQKIEPSFQKWLKELNFLWELCLKELNFFFEKKNSEKWYFNWLQNRTF